MAEQPDYARVMTAVADEVLAHTSDACIGLAVLTFDRDSTFVYAVRGISRVVLIEALRRAADELEADEARNSDLSRH